MGPIIDYALLTLELHMIQNVSYQIGGQGLMSWGLRRGWGGVEINRSRFMITTLTGTAKWFLLYLVRFGIMFCMTIGSGGCTEAGPR